MQYVRRNYPSYPIHLSFLPHNYNKSSVLSSFFRLLSTSLYLKESRSYCPWTVLIIVTGTLVCYNLKPGLFCKVTLEVTIKRSELIKLNQICTGTNMVKVYCLFHCFVLEKGNCFFLPQPYWSGSSQQTQATGNKSIAYLQRVYPSLKNWHLRANFGVKRVRCLFHGQWLMHSPPSSVVPPRPLKASQ